MRNKKAEIGWTDIVRATIAFILLLIILGIIYTYFVGGSIPFIARQTERVTEDCDGDGVIGIGDACPCNKDITELQKGNKDCGGINLPSEGKNKCPALCKN